MTDLYDKVEAAAGAVRPLLAQAPRVGIVLGTGLGGLAEKIEQAGSIDYDDVPHFPVSTVETHASRVVVGSLGGQSVVAMDGRFHLYEGYSIEQVTLPVRVFKQLGCEVLIVSGAVGGMNPQHAKGDIVIIEDHINLMGVSPLLGPNDERLGPRFPDMIAPYDRELIDAARQAALDNGIVAHTGVYVAVPGPNLETRAEYRFLRGIGADVVGMSTVPEVIVAVHAGLRTLGLSVVTDQCLADALKPVNIRQIIATAQQAEPRLCTIAEAVIAGL